jgi:DNA repair protein RadC
MNYSTALIQMPLVHEPSGEPIRTPEHTYMACIDLATLAQECFTVLSLSTKNRLLNRHLITLGIVDSSLVHPREVFRPIISDGASACILVHNHPSGDVTPSTEDLKITRQLVEAGKIIDIQVMDHVIVGRTHNACGSPWLSLREAGLVAF